MDRRIILVHLKKLWYVIVRRGGYNSADGRSVHEGASRNRNLPDEVRQVNATNSDMFKDMNYEDLDRAWVTGYKETYEELREI